MAPKRIAVKAHAQNSVANPRMIPTITRMAPPGMTTRFIMQAHYHEVTRRCKQNHPMPTEEQLLEIHRLALLGAETDIARDMTNTLADAWLGSSRFRDVEALCLRTLELENDASTLIYLGRAKLVLGDTGEAMKLHIAAQNIYEETNDRAGLATTLNNIGGIFDDTGLRKQALEYYGKALSIMEEVGNRGGQATTLNNIGMVYQDSEQPKLASEYFRKALGIREEVGDRAGLAVTLNNIGLVYHSTGQPEQALEYYGKALPIREEVGDRAGLAGTLNNIGGVYHTTGQPEQALEYYGKVLPIREEIGDRSGQAATLNNIGGVYRTTGRPEQAMEFYCKALPILEEVGNRAWEATTRRNMAMIYLEQKNLIAAMEQLRIVVDLDELVQSPDLESERALLAQVERELGV